MDSPSYQNISLFPAISANIAHIKVIFRNNTTTPFDPNNGGSFDSIYIDSTSGLTGTGSFSTNSHFTQFYSRLQEGDLFFIKQDAFNQPTIYRLDSKFSQTSFSNGVSATRGFTYTIVQGTTHLLSVSQRHISVERHIDPSVFVGSGGSQAVYQPIIGNVFMYGALNGNPQPTPAFSVSRHILSNIFPNLINVGGEAITNSGYISNTIPRVESIHYNSFEADINTYIVSGSSVDGYNPSLPNAVTAQDYIYDSHVLLGASTFSTINQSDQSFSKKVDHLSGAPNIDGPVLDTTYVNGGVEEGIFEEGKPLGTKYQGDNKSFNLYPIGGILGNTKLVNIYTGVFELR